MSKDDPASTASTTIGRKVTIFFGTFKFEAKEVRFRRVRRIDTDAFEIQFKGLRARSRNKFIDHEGRTVILEGWNHPDFEDVRVIQRPGEAAEFIPVTASELEPPRWDPVVGKFIPNEQVGPEQERKERALARYLDKLDKEKILLDTRGAIRRKD